MGRPVRAQWLRHDEHGWGPKRPPTLVDITGWLDAAGNVVAWQSEFWIPKVTLITEGVPFVAATLADLPRKPTLNPGNVFQNSAPSYTFANVHAVCHRRESTPFRPSWIRTPDACRTRTPTKCSWTSWPRRPGPIRSTFASAT